MGLGIAILLLAGNAVGFEILDTTDEEWVAPGYRITEDTSIDPLDYGEAFRNDGGEPAVGVHISFIGEETDEAWRVVLVLERKVVVLEEGSDPVEIPVDLEIESCAFSPSGRFVVVHDGAEEYTGRNAARIDTETGLVEVFDSQPDGTPGPRVIEASDTSILRCGLKFFGDDLTLIGQLDRNTRWSRGTMSPSGRFFATEVAWTSPSLICLFETDGDLLWEKEAEPYAFASLTDYIAFSPDETYLAVPLHSGLEIWETETGQTVWRDESARIGTTPIFDPNVSSFWNNGSRYDISDDLRAVTETITIGSGYDGQYRSWCVIASSPAMLLVALECRNPNLRRRAIVDPQGEVIWMTSASEMSFPGPLSMTGRAFRYDVNSVRFRLSSSGESIGLAPGDAIRFLGVREVE